MPPPGVFAEDVAKCGGGAALGHDGVGLAEQRPANERDFGPLGAGFDRGTQTGTARADHDDVVAVTLQVGHGGGHQKIRTSWITPIAQRRI